MMYIVSRGGDLVAGSTVKELWDCNVIQTAPYVSRVMTFEEFERRLNDGELVHTDIITAWRCDERRPDCEHLKRAIDNYKKAMELEREIIVRPFPLSQCLNPQCVPTGFNALDDITGGLRHGELTVIAGRPGMGKTTLCWSLAENITQNGGEVCVVAYKEGYVGTDKVSRVKQYHHLHPSLEPIDEMLFKPRM